MYIRIGEGGRVVLVLSDASGLEIAMRPDRAHDLSAKLEEAAWDAQKAKLEEATD